MGFLQKLIVFSFLVALLAALWYALAPKKVNIPKSSDLKHWWGRGAPNITEDAVMEDYQLRYEPDAVDDLKKRLSRTRYFDSLEDVDWDYGVNTKYVKHIIDYWLKSFSWEKQLNEINQYKHFRVNVDGIKIHFIHVKNTQAKVKPVIPVLLIHGWPGSFYEFYKLIPILMKEDLNFELVIPSLPGYGFSEAAEQKGLDQFYAGVILDKLMKKLGYNQYYAQGGDWGGFISKLMAIYFPSHVKGVHLNCYLCDPSLTKFLLGAVAPSLAIPDEKQRKKALPLMKLFGLMLEETGYMHIQGTKPDTVGFALKDSPAGLATYIIEKFATWSGCPPNASSSCIEKHFTKDELLTNVMIYWVTGSMPTSMRFHKEAFHGHSRTLSGLPVTVPTGLVDFPEEPFNLPKSWVEGCYQNIVSFTEMPRGGHFAAFQEPELLAEDLVKFIKKVEQL